MVMGDKMARYVWGGDKTIKTKELQHTAMLLTLPQGKKKKE